MKAILNFVARIYWSIYRLTPQGRQAWTFKKGFKGLLESNRLKTITKRKVILSASRDLKPRKILAFLRGRSITKSKASNHQVIETARHEHGAELTQRGLTITKNGKFKNA